MVIQKFNQIATGCTIAILSAGASDSGMGVASARIKLLQAEKKSSQRSMSDPEPIVEIRKSYSQPVEIWQSQKQDRAIESVLEEQWSTKVEDRQDRGPWTETIGDEHLGELLQNQNYEPWDATQNQKELQTKKHQDNWDKKLIEIDEQSKQMQKLVKKKQVQVDKTEDEKTDITQDQD